MGFYRYVDAYFMSGTGNSFRVAREFTEAAAARGATVTLTPMGPVNRPDQPEATTRRLILLTIPTHGFTTPWLALWFALRLPFGQGAHAAIVATRGGTKFGPLFLPGLDGTAAYLLALLLALKGYRIRGAMGLDMPSNWLAVHPGFSRPAAEAIIAHSRPARARFEDRILDGRHYFGSWIALPLGLLLLPVSLGYLLYGRALLGKLFFATNRCNGCGFCADHCQHHAIRMYDHPSRPYWTWRCESCMRCMAYCPRSAIEASHSLAVLAGLALSSYPAMLIGLLFSGDAPLAGSTLAGIARPALLYAVWLGLLMLIYALFWTVIRWQPVNNLFRFTTLTTLFRRYREPTTTASDMMRPKTPAQQQPAGSTAG